MFPPQSAPMVAWGSYGPYPYTYPVAGGVYPYSYPSWESGCCSGGVPFFNPWNMYMNPMQPWVTPQTSWNYSAMPMMPPKMPAYQMDLKQTERVWDSPESPQSPWLKAYNKKEQEEK